MPTASGRSCRLIEKVVDFGYGRHVWDVPPNNYNDLNIVCHPRPCGEIPNDHPVYRYRSSSLPNGDIIRQIILLFRIFSIDSGFRWVRLVLGPIIFLWSFISSFISIFRCRPFIAGWSLQYVLAHPHGYRCLDRVKLATVFGWYNIISDFILILLPMPILWGTHLSWQKKFGVAFVFATGGL